MEKENNLFTKPADLFSQVETEHVEPIINVTDLPMSKFDRIYRARFGKAEGRNYYVKGVDFYFSGLTNPIKKSGLVDYTFLNKASKDLAMQGIDSNELWGEKRDYGTCLHTLISMHERRDAERIPFEFADYTENGQRWREVVKQMCTDWNYPHLYPIWVEWLQNDFAAYFTWKKEYEVKVIASEVAVYNTDWKICTPLDLVVELSFNRKRIIANVNVKSGTSGYSGKDYSLQVVMELMLWNNYIKSFGEDIAKKYNMTGTFTLSPKDRDRSPGNYNFSKNYAGEHSIEEVNHVVNGCLLNKLYEPKGKLRFYEGDEENGFSVQVVNPADFLAAFNKN